MTHDLRAFDQDTAEPGSEPIPDHNDIWDDRIIHFGKDRIMLPASPRAPAR